MSAPHRRTHLEEDICIHIFTVSAGMVGVCLTVIGLLHVVTALRKVDTIADNLLALDSVLFLVSCLTAYWALRTRSNRRMHVVERLADCSFILALLLMAAICVFIAYTIAFAPFASLPKEGEAIRPEVEGKIHPNAPAQCSSEGYP